MTSVTRPDVGRPFDTAPAFPAPAVPPVRRHPVPMATSPADQVPARPSTVAATAARVGWTVPAMLGVLGLAAIVYLWDLTISGYANTYYAMAAQAASQSWTAWLFGSLDAGNFITLDKPPFATMVMGLSVRLFGLSSWSILLPQALAGVATVGILMLTVRRGLGAATAYTSANAGRTRYAWRYLVRNAKPMRTPASTTQRWAPEAIARVSA